MKRSDANKILCSAFKNQIYINEEIHGKDLWTYGDEFNLNSTGGGRILTDIPSTARTIQLFIKDASFNTNNGICPVVHMADQDADETTGYKSMVLETKAGVAANAYVTNSIPCAIAANALNTDAFDGVLSLYKWADNTTNYRWLYEGKFTYGSDTLVSVSGHKATTKAMIHIGFHHSDGGTQFDAGYAVGRYN